MTKKKHISYQQLEQTLELYGCAFEKWPIETRNSLSEMIDTDHKAKTLWQDHQAFEKTLDMGQVSPAPKQLTNLQNSILSIVAASASQKAQESQNLSKKIGKSVFMQALTALQQQLTPLTQLKSQNYGAISLLAASLLIGIFLGLSDGFGLSLPQSFQLAFFDNVKDGLSFGGLDNNPEYLFFDTELL